MTVNWDTLLYLLSRMGLVISEGGRYMLVFLWSVCQFWLADPLLFFFVVLRG